MAAKNKTRPETDQSLQVRLKRAISGRRERPEVSDRELVAIRIAEMCSV